LSRLIILVAIVALIYWLIKKYSGQVNKSDSEQVDKPENSQVMVSCSHCGLNFPKNEGIFSSGKYYCCAEHSREQSDK
jgi:uncharacterized protein